MKGGVYRMLTLVKLCRFAVVLKIDVNCLLIFAFRSVV